MNVLSMGRPFGTPGEPVAHFNSQRGHDIRTLAEDAAADFTFSPNETAEAVLARVDEIWPVDLFICWCPEVAPPPRNMEACPVRTAAVVSDWTVHFPQLEHNLLRYDVVATDALGAAALARVPGLTPHYFGPLYSHRTGVHGDLGLTRDIDIAFAGNLNHAVHARRGRLLDKVAALSDRYHVVIASELDDQRYTELLSRTRIAFNHTLRQEMNLRCFEAIACGALLFVEEDNREIREYLTPGVDVVLYNDDTLVPLLEQHLADSDASAVMAQRAGAKAPTLAGEARLDDWIDALAAAPGSGRTFNGLSPETRALADVLQHPNADFAWDTLPQSPALSLAHGLQMLSKMAFMEADERRATLPVVLRALQDVATECSDAVVPWLNLAFVLRLAHRPDGEERFLDLARQATKARFGGLLVGGRQDPFYNHWREALARGTASPGILHATVLCRQAALALDRSDWDVAEALTTESLKHVQDIGLPYRLRAQALTALGRHDEAVATLERGLPLTALESDHRADLILAYRAVGREADARALAQQSAAIFRAWWGADHAVRRFEELL